LGSDTEMELGPGTDAVERGTGRAVCMDVCMGFGRGGGRVFGMEFGRGVGRTFWREEGMGRVLMDGFRLRRLFG